ARELAEEGVGNKFYIVDGEKEPHGCADIERLVELLRQHVELQRRPARMGDKTGEAGNRAPETAFLKARLRHPILWYFADIVIEGEGNAEEAEDKLDDIGAQIVEEEIAGGDADNRARQQIGEIAPVAGPPIGDQPQNIHNAENGQDDRRGLYRGQ